MKNTVLLASMVVAAGSLYAQAPSDPLSAGTKGMYNIVRNYVAQAAEKMPEENYSFQPTPEVRTFARLIGHIADANYAFCAAVLGEKNPAPGIEKNKTSKADLVAGLKDAFAYCDKAYDGMTDAHGAELVKFFGREQAKLVVLGFNTAHTDEHYGNIVTYMRIKGLVPPSSERRR